MSGRYVDRLHTDSSYVTWEADFNNMASFPSATWNINGTIKALEAKELEFYNKFGYASVDQFYNGIKNIMKGAEKDFKILDNFNSDNIKRAVMKFENNHLIDSKAIIHFKCEKDFAKEINETLKKIGGENIVYIDGEISIGFKWNENTFKKIVNKLTGKRRKKIESVYDVIKNEKIPIDLSISGSNQLPDYEINYKENPFRYTKNELQFLDKNTLTNIRNQLVYFLWENLEINKGSTELQRAADDVVTKTILNKLENISFFEGGHGGWVSSIQGAAGELRAAIFFEYLAMKCPNSEMSYQISEIIGNKSGDYKQQFHSDLQLFESFGIQVKNYNSAYYKNREKDVTVALHPLEIAPLVNEEETVSYLLNSYFNKDLGTIHTTDMEKFFEANALELLNLDLPTTVNIPNKVSFYLVGNHLIPGSAIIKEGFGDEVKNPIKIEDITITGRTSGPSSWYNDKDAKPFRAIRWWHRKGEGWEPTDENQLSAWDKFVSIKTHFKYASFWETGEFEIF